MVFLAGYNSYKFNKHVKLMYLIYFYHISHFYHISLHQSSKAVISTDLVNQITNRILKRGVYLTKGFDNWILSSASKTFDKYSLMQLKNTNRRKKKKIELWITFLLLNKVCSQDKLKKVCLSHLSKKKKWKGNYFDPRPEDTHEQFHLKPNVEILDYDPSSGSILALHPFIYYYPDWICPIWVDDLGVKWACNNNSYDVYHQREKKGT